LLSTNNIPTTLHTRPLLRHFRHRHTQEKVEITGIECDNELEAFGINPGEAAVFAKVMHHFLYDASRWQVMSGPMSRIMLTRGPLNGLHYYWTKATANVARHIAKGTPLEYLWLFVKDMDNNEVKGMQVIPRTVGKMAAIDDLLSPVMKSALLSNHALRTPDKMDTAPLMNVTWTDINYNGACDWTGPVLVLDKNRKHTRRNR
jgi:hypothetical protein